MKIFFFFFNKHEIYEEVPEPKRVENLCVRPTDGLQPVGERPLVITELTKTAQNVWVLVPVDPRWVHVLTVYVGVVFTR